MGVIIYPEKLKLGDTIGVSAVSMPANEEKIDLAIKNFENLGLKVQETKDVRNYGGIVSDDGRTRAEELLELYRDADVKYIIAARGGEFLMEMMPYLHENRDVIKNNPKWFQGFSDPSLINLYITTNFNIATVNFENISEYAMNPRFKNLSDSIAFMFDSKEEYIQDSFEFFQKDEFEEGNLKGYNLTEKDVYESQNGNVSFSGRIIGGCIDVFSQIAGTDMDNVSNFVSQFEDDGVIWYIDNCELQPCEFYRRLWHMDKMGYFKNLNGVIVGRSMVENTENEFFSFKDAVHRAMDKFNVPIVFKADIGHIPPQMFVINGSYATFEYNDGKGRLIQKLI